MYLNIFPSLDNLLPDSAGMKTQAGQGGNTGTQLQPFSVRFKNIIVKLAELCSFFSAMERSEMSKIFNRNKL